MRPRVLAWVRCQTRPFPAYLTQGGPPLALWGVWWDGEYRCWRAERNGGTAADVRGRPLAFDGMDLAMRWCERAARQEEADGFPTLVGVDRGEQGSG